MVILRAMYTNWLNFRVYICNPDPTSILIFRIQYPYQFPYAGMYVIRVNLRILACMYTRLSNVMWRITKNAKITLGIVYAAWRPCTPKYLYALCTAYLWFFLVVHCRSICYHLCFLPYHDVPSYFMPILQAFLLFVTCTTLLLQLTSIQCIITFN